MQLRFKEKHPETGDIATFIFAPESPTRWVAGQSIRLEIPSFYGPEERRLTISAAPREESIAVTTRKSDSTFKQALFGLQPGTIVQAHDIRGEFIWSQEVTQPILVATGIGITPFRAMLQERMLNEEPLDAALLYASRDEPMLFANDIGTWQIYDADFEISLLQERIGIESVMNIANWQERPFYIAGPTKMVDDLTASLMRSGLPASQLRRDWFTGRFPKEG